MYCVLEFIQIDAIENNISHTYIYIYNINFLNLHRSFYLVLIGNLDGLFPFSIKFRNIGCLLLVDSNSSGNDRDCCFICFIPPVVSNNIVY